MVNIFDLNGTLLRHLVPVGGNLNAPWGVAKAPAGFGSLSNMLLIGNFGDGVINGYDPTTGVFAGSIKDSAGTTFANAGLWGIAFGNTTQNQPATTLYFAAGIAGETAGLYGRIDLGETAPDIVAPTVALTTPAAGTVSATATLTATVADNVGVAQVDFLLRSGTTTTTLGSDTSAPYSFDLNTTTLANGAYTLTAQAVDTGGNSTTSADVAVTVNNGAASVTLAQLQTDIFTPSCSGCHSGNGATLPGVLNLSSASASFAALVNVASIEVPALNRVTPNDPANSYLVQKLEGTQSLGSRMPLGGSALSQANIDNVKAWINSGAPQ
jgi:mono/diheme cytochrome c family protein